MLSSLISLLFPKLHRDIDPNAILVAHSLSYSSMRDSVQASFDTPAARFAGARDLRGELQPSCQESVAQGLRMNAILIGQQTDAVRKQDLLDQRDQRGDIAMLIHEVGSQEHRKPQAGGRLPPIHVQNLEVVEAIKLRVP
jgi:hypothetical protein